MSNQILKYAEANINITPEVNKLLDSLPLYDFYKKFDNEFKNSISSHKKCSVCGLSLTMITEESRKLNNLCKKVCYILLNFKDMEKLIQRLTNDKCCAYMSTWLFNHITNIPNFNLKSDDFYSAINIISQNELSKIKNCTLENYKINKSVFNNDQILYEFLEIYKKIEEKLTSTDDSSKNIYCKHIKQIFSHYHRIKNICATDDSCSKYKELLKFKEKFKELNIINLICEKCDFKKSTCKHGSTVEDDVPCLSSQKYGFLFLIFGDDPEHIINVLFNVTIISAPILALFLILFKFTPFGKTLKKLKQEGRKNGRQKKEENIQDYMKNYAAYVDSAMKNRVHLTYHNTNM
ncbi:PIR protein [Plasmodium vivax]|uniref:VIR protein n=1 Tax=Plasmodium vivax TaxID=5855 RepID=A0A565A7D7_PLAVI|nr:PIR protein [Plasmodium vivax]